MADVNKKREALKTECRTLIPDMEINGEKVGMKNKSMYREYLKTSEGCRSLYTATISRKEMINEPINYEGHLGKHYNAGLPIKETHIIGDLR